MPDENLLEITVTGIVRDEGSVVVFRGFHDDSPHADEAEIRFACDHGPAQVLADALAAGEWPLAGVADWQIIG